MIKYPIRCRIVDVDGTGYKVGPYFAATPDKSKPHIGKEGLAEKTSDEVKITLDDGSILYGHQCWWEPIELRGYFVIERPAVWSSSRT